MAGIRKTPAGHWRAYWRSPAGKQESKTFRTKREAAGFLAQMRTSALAGAYVSPQGGRVLFGAHARQWMASWNTEATTSARDESVMRVHVLAQWEMWPLAKIESPGDPDLDHWPRRPVGSPATIVECRRLLAAVMRSAVRNRMIMFNPCEDIRVPKRRKQDTDEQVISRETFRHKLLPVVPDRYRGIVAVAGGAGLRWGEAAGLCADAVDLDAGTVRVIRTVVEVAGTTSFKGYPKSTAGRRSIPLTAWLVEILRAHVDQFGYGEADLLFGDQVGGALRRTLFRSRVWRPALVRAGLLGSVTEANGKWIATWTSSTGQREQCSRRAEGLAVAEVARGQRGGLRFHDLRRSYATWLVDDGVPPNMVQRVMGHERAATTLDLYTRRTDNPTRILQALEARD